MPGAQGRRFRRVKRRVCDAFRPVGERKDDAAVGARLRPHADVGQGEAPGRGHLAREGEGFPRLRLSYIGFVFQSHNLIEALSAQDNLALLLQLRGWSHADARREAARLLESVGLSDKRDSKPRDLSGGQRQRVAIARALAGAPPILLADEPTAALDAHNGYVVTELLRVLAKVHGHTVVVVTHDARIFHLADRIVHIEDGLIAERTS